MPSIKKNKGFIYLDDRVSVYFTVITEFSTRMISY